MESDFFKGNSRNLEGIRYPSNEVSLKVDKIKPPKKMYRLHIHVGSWDQSKSYQIKTVDFKNIEDATDRVKFLLYYIGNGFSDNMFHCVKSLNKIFKVIQEEQNYNFDIIQFWNDYIGYTYPRSGYYGILRTFWVSFFDKKRIEYPVEIFLNNKSLKKKIIYSRP